MGEKDKKGQAGARLLIISYDVVGSQMAGPGIRFYEFARLLSECCDVTLAAPNKIDIDTQGFRAVQYSLTNYRALRRYTEDADIILIQGHILYHFPFLKNFKGKIIVDLYNPFHLESLEMFREMDEAERLRIDKNNLYILKLQLNIGDFFICASEKQRDYWIGMLTSAGRINPYNYDGDSTFRSLINVVPFGIPSQPPQHTKNVIKGVLPGVREDDKIVLWGGGIWNWLDPITAIKALWEVTRNRGDIKMVFIGLKHPDPNLPQMRKCVEAIKLSKELDLFDKYVFFYEWTPYEARQNFLLEADAGLSIHHERIETEFSYRTRVMDYIWAKLPIITTKGDSMADMVKKENIGEVVGYENTHQLARVMENMLSNKSLREIYRKNLEKIVPQFYWENVTRPLIEYCLNPDYAVDKRKIVELINLQNSKISNIIKSNFEDATNILVVTSNRYKDKELFPEEHIGKIFYLEVDESIERQKSGNEILDKVGILKSRISGRTKFDGIIVNNTFSKITPKFFYDLLNVLSAKLKSEGLLFFSMPETRGLSKIFGEGETEDRLASRIDDFTIEYIFKNVGFEIVDKGIWDRVESPKAGLEDKEVDPGEIYGKNELFELFEIKLNRDGFKDLKLLSRFDILESKELSEDKTIVGKFRKFLYLVTSMYFENLRRSYNESIKAISNNIHLQINREINELNRKNRERMLLIYFNIFRSLQIEIKNLGYDIGKLKEILEEIAAKRDRYERTSELDQRLDILTRDFENIDQLMGLTVSNKYYLARKLGGS